MPYSFRQDLRNTFSPRRPTLWLLLAIPSTLAFFAVVFADVKPYPGMTRDHIIESSITAIPLVFCCLMFWRTSRIQRLLRDRLEANHCPACGYDLRASPDYCPECGTQSPTRKAP